MKREGSRWFVILSCDDVPARPLSQTGAVAGIDLGVASLVTTSDGIERVTLDGETDLIHNARSAIEVDLAPDESAIIFGVNGQPDLTLLRL